MRILFISDLWKPFPGGAESYVFNVAREMERRGHTIGVLTSYEKAIPAHPDFDFTLDALLGSWILNPPEVRAPIVRRKLEEFRPDVVFVHRFFAEDKGVALGLEGQKVVEIVHYHHHFKDARFIVYNSEFTKREWPLNQVSIPSMVILPPAYVGEVGHGDRNGHIGFVKPLEGKGAAMFYQIVDQFPNRQFAVLRGEWKDLEDYRPRPNILFVDPVKSMDQFYSLCRIMLVPSLREDAGTIPQEAALAEIPCIAARTMGLVETNAGGIFPSHPYPECWAEEIRKLDSYDYYDAVVEKQLNYVQSIDWPAKFDALDAKVRSL